MVTIHAYQMTATDAPLERVTLPAPEPGEGEALVEVAGCGVCHTDLGFWHDGVPPVTTCPWCSATKSAVPFSKGHLI